MSWHDDLEEALVAMSVSTFKGLAVCQSYYENYEDPNYWEDEHDKKPKPTEIKDEAIGCMICNLHDKGADERAEDLEDDVLTEGTWHIYESDLCGDHSIVKQAIEGEFCDDVEVKLYQENGKQINGDESHGLFVAYQGGVPV